MSTQNEPHKIIVVGGGAGGLELATKLGRKLGKKGKAEIILIDQSRTHIWKPLLHEVAAGTLDSHENEIEYLAQATHCHFRFRLGQMTSVDRDKKEIYLAPTFNDQGEEIIPQRSFQYDTLIMALGSVSHDFEITGVAEHCLFLDSTKQAEEFQKNLLESYLKAHAQNKPIESGQLDVAIVGAGATGTELAAQLHEVSHLLNSYGLDQVEPAEIKMSIIEAADRILPGIIPRLSAAVTVELEKLGIEVLTSERVVEVDAKGIRTDKDNYIPASIKVWAAGIKAPDFLKETGLEVNGINQLVVNPQLQTSDASIFALGDCAACDWPGNEGNVPPRAQAAHQQASLLYKTVKARLAGRPLPTFKYFDYGSLVSLGNYSTVGNLMGGIMGSIKVEGLIARMVYLSLHKMHQMALFGPVRMAILTLSHIFRRSVHPSIKLH